MEADIESEGCRVQGIGLKHCAPCGLPSARSKGPSTDTQPCRPTEFKSLMRAWPRTLDPEPSHLWQLQQVRGADEEVAVEAADAEALAAADAHDGLPACPPATRVHAQGSTLRALPNSPNRDI